VNTLNRHTQRRLQMLTAHLTATEGPLRLALDQLSRRGIGERIIKSALAATIAWLIAGQVPRESAPFVAALTAVYTMDLTILKSLRSAGQRLAGITLGIGVAFLAAEFLGVHAWSVGLVILISLVIGLRLNLTSDGMTQVAGTAIVVLVVRATTEARSLYALTFLADTAIGTAIGLLINGIVSPPNFLPTARRALDALTNRLIDLLDQLATMVVDGITPEEATSLAGAIGRLQDDLRAIDESLSRSEESMRFNLLASRQREHLATFHDTDRRLAPVVDGLQRLVIAVGEAAGTAWMENRLLTEQIANLISAVTVILSETETPGSLANAQDLVDRTAELTTSADQIYQDLPDHSWSSLGRVTESAKSLARSASGRSGG
jgi:uncharacterized membrane protein YgaE (UPF0421/DUF939 family)